MKKFWIVATLIVLIFAGSLIFFNYRIMKSDLGSDSNAASSSNMSKDEVWNFNPEITGLYVEGDYRYMQPLRDELTHRLNHQGKIGSISSVILPMDQADNPQLYVKVREQKKTWTPFIATSAIEVVVSYASDGDVSFRNSTPPKFVYTSEVQALRYQANYAIADRSYGLISMRGYDDYLVQVIADAVEKSVQEQLKTN